LHKTGPSGLVQLRLCQYNIYLQYRNKGSPVGRAIRAFPPPPPRARVTGLAPGDTKIVSDPRYMLIDNIPIRARPLFTCVTPNREVKGVAQGEHRVPRVPKKEGAINPINLRGELGMLAFP